MKQTIQQKTQKISEEYPEEKERVNVAKTIFEEIMAENWLKLMGDVKARIQEAQ